MKNGLSWQDSKGQMTKSLGLLETEIVRVNSLLRNKDTLMRDCSQPVVLKGMFRIVDT